MIGVTSPLYFLFMIFVYIGTIIVFIRRQVKKYTSFEKPKDKKTPAWHYAIATIAPAAGYLFSHYIMGLTSSLTLLFMSIIFLIIAVFYIFILARSYQKYFFIKQNLHLVDLTVKTKEVSSSKMGV